MILESYGVTLRKLEETDIELVRQWRNDPEISKFMVYRDYITIEMQKKWFLSVNNEDNYYFIIELEDEKIGLTELKKINWYDRSAESGVFIYSNKHQNGVLSYQVLLSLLDFGFNDLKLEKVNAQILASNKRAIRFNKSLGFQENLTHDKSENGVLSYSLTKDEYLQRSITIKEIITRECKYERTITSIDS